MEDHFPRSASQLAAIVRDFSPSRLERQLLAQAFDLAWNRSLAVDAARNCGSVNANDRLDWQSSVSRATSAQAARR